MFEALPNPPLTADTVAASTQQCTVLKEVYAAIQEGNVQKLKGEHFNAYRKRATELSTHRGCITLGSRVVIPAALREQAMSLVHAGHRGIVAIKNLASLPLTIAYLEGTELLDTRLVRLLVPVFCSVRKDASGAVRMSLALSVAQAQHARLTVPQCIFLV
ncbi:hypothetical protein MTO96_042288 [Rhipicephalus appendiculatus]